jgi:hypothetical protein
LVLQQTNNTYILILCRNRQIWDRPAEYAAGTGHGDGTGFNTGIGRRRVVADPKSVKLTLPAGTWTAEIAEPAKNNVDSTLEPTNYTGPIASDPNVPDKDFLTRTDAPGTPNDGVQYPNIDDGQAYEFATAGTDPLAASPWFTKSGNDLYVQMAGLTRVIRIVKTG